MTDTTDDPIFGCIERWHRHLRGDLEGGLDALLHEDCVFVSPIVFTPQEGRELTALYLTAAAGTLGGADVVGEAGQGGDTGPALAAGSSFHYVTEVLQGHHAVLEFESTVEDTWVNGVDMITCDDDGMITEFKVMIRPLRAINLLHAQMRDMLEKLGGSSAG